MKKKALLLDRDGVVNVEHGYVGHRDRFEFMDGIFDLLHRAIDEGYYLVLVTNQAGVAKGYYKEEDFEALTAYMLQEMKKEGINFSLIQWCFEHPDSEIHRYKRLSFWRKPSAGMILEAAVKLNIDLQKSIMVGDKLTDIQAAQNAGVGTILWLGGQSEMDRIKNVHTLEEVKTYL
ncbi:MAG: D-glycero-alpha-D-manno-heptose-1,7-bisphosphate 7-phosphatase [Bdellovibrionales bacterium]